MAERAVTHGDLTALGFDQLSTLPDVIGSLRSATFGRELVAPAALVTLATIKEVTEIALAIIDAFDDDAEDLLAEINIKLDKVLYNQEIIIGKLDEIISSLKDLLELTKSVPFDTNELAYFINVQSVAVSIKRIAGNVQNSETPETVSVTSIISQLDMYFDNSNVFVSTYSQAIPQIAALFSLYSSLRVFYAASIKYKGPKLFPDKVWFRDKFKQLGDTLHLVVDSKPVPGMKEHFLSVLNEKRKDVEIQFSAVPDSSKLAALYGSAFNVSVPDGKYVNIHNWYMDDYWESCGGEFPDPRAKSKGETDRDVPLPPNDEARFSTFGRCKPGYVKTQVDVYFSYGIVKLDLGSFLTDEYRYVPTTHSKNHTVFPVAGQTYIDLYFEMPKGNLPAGPDTPWTKYQKSIMTTRVYVIWLRATEALRNAALKNYEQLK